MGFKDPGQLKQFNTGLRGLESVSQRGSLFGSGGRIPLSVESKKRAADLERVLNDYSNSYARVMNAKPEDVGPALLANVQLSLGLVNLQQEN